MKKSKLMVLLISCMVSTINPPAYSTERETEEIETEDMVDMNEVVDYKVTEYGLQLYFADGTGYFLEKRK